MLCQMNGWEYKVYSDTGFSGKNLNRPAFKNAMKDIESGKADMIIAYRFDRISRSMADFTQLIVKLEEHNAKFTSATENFDTSIPFGRAMVGIIMIFAELERNTITERVVDNYYYRGDLGYWPGGTAPYGYKLIKVTDKQGCKRSALEIDPIQANYIKEMFEMYVQPDGSIRKIITKLNSENVPTNRNSQWTSRVVADILERPIYTSNSIDVYNYYREQGANIINPIEDFDGRYSLNLYGKVGKNVNRHKRCREANEMKLIILNHIPIIDSDLWLKVQQKRTANAKTPNRSGTSQNSYLTGLLICGECGHRVSIIKDGTGWRGYVCSTRKNRGKDICPLPILNAKKMESIVCRDLIEHFTVPDVIQSIKQVAESQPLDLNPERAFQKNSLETQIQKIDQEIETLVTSIAQGNDTLIKYANIKIEQLDNQRKVLVQELSTLDLEQFSERTEIEKYRDIYYFIQGIDVKVTDADFAQMKFICNMLIESVTFFADDVKINYVV